MVGTMSTSERSGVNRHIATCTSPVSVVLQCKLVSGWELRAKETEISVRPPYGPYGLQRTLIFTFTLHYLTQ